MTIRRRVILLLGGQPPVRQPPSAGEASRLFLRSSHDWVSRSVVALIEDRKPNNAISAPNSQSVRLKAPAASRSAPRPSIFRIAPGLAALGFGEPRGARDILWTFGDSQRVLRRSDTRLLADASDVLGKPDKSAGLLRAESGPDRADARARPHRRRRSDGISSNRPVDDLAH